MVPTNEPFRYYFFTVVEKDKEGNIFGDCPTIDFYNCEEIERGE
jgi:hypothetical protein